MPTFSNIFLHSRQIIISLGGHIELNLGGTDIMVDYPSTRKDETPVSREQLYEEVWAEPMTKVALKYGVSSSFMARVCSWLNVPRPERGYWAKLAVGKSTKQPPLPDAEPGDELEWNRYGPARRAKLPVPKPPMPPTLVGVALTWM